jgi:hypothetical protein
MKEVCCLFRTFFSEHPLYTRSCSRCWKDQAIGKRNNSSYPGTDCLIRKKCKKTMKTSQDECPKEIWKHSQESSKPKLSGTISQRRCWSNDHLSSGEGSKLVNLFFLPNEPGNMRTLNYLSGRVPAPLLPQALYTLSPAFPKLQCPTHPPTH